MVLGWPEVTRRGGSPVQGGHGSLRKAELSVPAMENKLWKASCNEDVLKSPLVTMSGMVR